MSGELEFAALIVVDVQNDFVSGTLALSGCPAMQDGAEVVPAINTIRKAVPFAHVAITQDWHPHNHVSFHECLVVENTCPAPVHPTHDGLEPRSAKIGDVVTLTAPNGTDAMPQTLWPRHCVQNSWGSRIHEGLQERETDLCVRKGTNPRIDSYSAFVDNGGLEETSLHASLSAWGVKSVYICGLAFDVCVAFTALDAIARGYATTVIVDACRGVTAQGIEDTKQLLAEKGVELITSAALRERFEDKAAVDTVAESQNLNDGESPDLDCSRNDGGGRAGPCPGPQTPRTKQTARKASTSTARKTSHAHGLGVKRSLSASSLSSSCHVGMRQQIRRAHMPIHRTWSTASN